MSLGFGRTKEKRPRGGGIPEVAFCEEKNRLTIAFLEAFHEVSSLQSQQTQAIIDGDADSARFDSRLHLAHQTKDKAKSVWIAHVESHHCGEG